ncbi:MAG: complex I subunit 4 family protein [Vulcanimicrobiaceae bacterium]
MAVLVLVLLPAVAGALLFLLPRDDVRASKTIGALVALATIVLAVFARHQQFSATWLTRPFVSNLHFGATSISWWIVLLLGIATFGAILATNVSRTRSFIALLLFLEASMLGLFLARDLLLFALCWDLMLIPVFLGLIHWGSHPATAWRYFIYNFAGGLLLLLATAAFGLSVGTTDVIGGTGIALVGPWVPWIFAGFAIAFLVKTPVWPLHTWMPLTYADTPAPMISVVAGVQSKAGLYGFITIGMVFLPEMMRAYAGLFITLGIISLLYGAVASLVQTDAKRVVAYSSLSHLGLILVAIFSFNPIALAGALIYIVAHGLFSAALFLGLGYVEEREETRSLVRLGGLGAANPRLTGALCIAVLAALGLPGLAGFAGELLMLIGIFAAGFAWAAILGLVAVVLASAYFLRLFQGMMNGPVRPDLPMRRDLTWIEALAVVPLLLALLVLGVNPHPLTTFNTAPYLQSSGGGR